MEPSLPSLRQESVVEVAGRELRVVSQIVLEPEVIVMTEVILDEVVHRKSHVALPPATVRDYERRGTEALVGSLYACHLRYVRRLLSAPSSTSERRSAPAGVLGTLLLGSSGEVKDSAGEDHVPGGWLRAPYLLSAFADRVGSALGTGELARMVCEGDGIALLLVRQGKESAVAFVSSMSTTELRGLVEEHLREISCAPR